MAGEVTGSNGEAGQRQGSGRQFIATIARLAVMLGVMTWMRRGKTPPQNTDGARPRSMRIWHHGTFCSSSEWQQACRYKAAAVCCFLLCRSCLLDTEPAKRCAPAHAGPLGMRCQRTPVASQAWFAHCLNICKHHCAHRHSCDSSSACQASELCLTQRTRLHAGHAGTSALLQPQLPAGTPVAMDLYLSHRPLFYGRPVAHVPELTLGDKKLHVQQTVHIDESEIEQVRACADVAARAAGHCNRCGNAARAACSHV